MCELLGMSFNLPVRPSFSFRGLRARGEYNPHGWGIGFYPDASAQVLKEPVESKLSHLSRFLLDYRDLQSAIFIAHVRVTSVGKISRRNTHPFTRELDGIEYLFAHNGTLGGFRELETGRFRPIGETDSEHAFCALLNSLSKSGRALRSDDDFDWLAGQLGVINGYGKFNCLMSNGSLLFAYLCRNGYRSLHFLERTPPYGDAALIDEDWKIDLGKMKDPAQKGFIVATEPLTDEAWEAFRPGELMVFRGGELVFSNRRTTGCRTLSA